MTTADFTARRAAQLEAEAIALELEELLERSTLPGGRTLEEELATPLPEPLDDA